LLADGGTRFGQIPTTIIKHGLPALLTLSSLCKGEAKEEESEIREEVGEEASKNGHILTIVNAKAGEDTNSFLTNFPIPTDGLNRRDNRLQISSLHFFATFFPLFPLPSVYNLCRLLFILTLLCNYCSWRVFDPAEYGCPDYFTLRNNI
jgi:hypothetical protein